MRCLNNNVFEEIRERHSIPFRSQQDPTKLAKVSGWEPLMPKCSFEQLLGVVSLGFGTREQGPFWFMFLLGFQASKLVSK